MDYTYLLYIAIILIFTKAFGLLSKVIKLPQVVGALVAGIILGPVCLNLVSLDNAPILSNLSEIGVIVLMFVAGLETDIREMKKCGLASSIIALIGVIVPLVGGAATAFLFGTADPTLSTSTFLQDVFVGVILTATSVSITVETLKELGKLNTRAGNAILGAALIDDVLGIIALTVITSLADPESGNIGIVILKILASSPSHCCSVYSSTSYSTSGHRERKKISAVMLSSALHSAFSLRMLPRNSSVLPILQARSLQVL